MGVLGGCAAVALMWWAQAPVEGALERSPVEQPQPGQLLHPLVLQIDTPSAPSTASDGQRLPEPVPMLSENAPPVENATPEPIADESTTRGAHDPIADVQLERPQIFQSRPSRPLALDLPR